MENTCRSLELILLKANWRRKYSDQLKRNYALSINTAEGWNDSLRVGHSNILIDKGIEPTEENLAIFQGEVAALVEELQKKYPPDPRLHVWRSCRAQ